ncbi:MAG TPA: acyl-CoA dehydrogenase family protein [Gemmataceae bacterium]|nr:acyl-CoA dehydrogenase family protein [Gemmataceae bacterium]
MSPQDSRKLLADVEAFCQEIRPVEEWCYAEHKFNDQVAPLAKKHNILGMIVPKDLGGRGADTVTYARALARIGREGTGVRTFFSGHTSIGEYPIATWGSDDLKKRYLPAACRGEKILAFGLTEPEAGSNPLELQSTYQRRGDQFILNGVKYLISNGGIADAIVVFAYPLTPQPPSPAAAGEGGVGSPHPPSPPAGGEGGKGGEGKPRMSAFVIDTKVPGFSSETLLAKMGMPTANTAMFEMKDVAIPAANLLGTEGDGFRIAMGSLVSGRISVAAGSLGVIEDCLAEAVTYAKERMQHGKPIAKHQLVQEHIAIIEQHRVASERMILWAAELKDAVAANPKDAEAWKQADLAAAQAKLFVANAAWDAADRAVQVFGGRGFSTLYRPGRHLQDVRVCRIYEGTDEILKLKIAASVLGGKEWEAFK